MTGFRVYRRVSEAEIRKMEQDCVEKAAAFFDNNPDREDATCELWYGKVYTIKRGTIDDITEQVKGFADATIEEDNKARQADAKQNN